MDKLRNILALLIALVLLLLPPISLAAGGSVSFGNNIETHAAQTKASAAGATKQPGRASLGDITWSTEALYQVLVNEKHIDFRLHGDNVKCTFRLGFEEYMGSVLMTLTVSKVYETFTPVYTFDALAYLVDIGVTYVRIVDPVSESLFEICALALMLEI